MTDLDRLLELARKATPGPWTYYRGGFSTGWEVGGPRDTVAGEITFEGTAAYIAACDPDTIIGLIERVKEAE